MKKSLKIQELMFLGLLLTLAGCLPFSAFSAESLEWRKIEEGWREWSAFSEGELKQKAKAGNPLAKYFYYVKTVQDQPQDQERWALAERYLEEASTEGVPHAIHRQSGKFREKDHAKYGELLERAAATGLPTAQLELATELLEGERVPLDEARAVEWVRQAADAGYHAAQYELAEMYACGMGEPRHDAEGPFELCWKAAQHGNSEAMAELGRRFRVGLSVERDIMESARWYWRAAQAGDNKLNRFLDEEFNPLASGDAEIRLFSHFLSLYIRAAVQRDPSIMERVGKAFLQGEFGKKNPTTGYFWLSFAARKGAAVAEFMTEAEAHLSEEETAKLQRELDQYERTPVRSGRRR